jgi:hypothetical protein
LLLTYFAYYCVQGMKRLFGDIDEISVDVPAAHVLLQQIVNKLRVRGVMNDELARCMPQRFDLDTLIRYD